MMPGRVPGRPNIRYSNESPLGVAMRPEARDTPERGGRRPDIPRRVRKAPGAAVSVRKPAVREKDD
jgi:hypothetical protein